MTDFTVDRVVEAAQARGLSPKKRGKGWVCRCPAHDDTRPSLSIDPGDNGTALIQCRSRGCAFDAIVEGLGLRRPSTRSAARAPRPPARAAADKPRRTFPTVDAAIEGDYRQFLSRYGDPIRHPYRDADGAVVGYTLRFQAPEKKIRPLALQSAGGWAGCAMDDPRVPYRLPELLEHTGRVFVVEGEKAADALVGLDVVVTTSAGGCKAAAQTDWAALRDRDVVILPDHDEPGEEYAADVAKAAAAAGAASVRVVRLVEIFPEMPEGGDAHDWLEARDAVDPAHLREQLEELVDATPPEAGPGEAPRASRRGLVLVRASEIECTSIHWLWPQRVVGDGLTIVTGPVGASKSLVSIDIAARVSTGGLWPDGTGHAPEGSVILFGAEDDAGSVVVPRLVAAGADLSRVHVCQGSIGEAENDDEEIAAVVLERHIGQLREALDDVADCRLIIFDPLPDYLAADENKSAEVRAALVPLARLAQERNVAILAVAHQNKKSDLTTVQRIAGSGAFAQIARVVLAIGNHPEDADVEVGRRRVMLVSKSNYGESNVGQSYRIEKRTNGPGLVWDPGIVTMDADELSRRPTGGREHESRRSEAVDALREILATGEQYASTVTATLQDAGLGRRQINHAAAALNVVKEKRREGWLWRLPAKPEVEDGPQPDPAFAAWGFDRAVGGGR